MEILILRDGQQAGPYSEEAVHTLLSNGEVRLGDMAWRKGMGDWLPLGEILGVTTDTVVPTSTPLPASQASASAEETVAPARVELKLPTIESASQRQKALLTYLCIPFSSDLTKEKAALLLNDALESPKHSVALKRWEDDRLRLYPDLFADEIKARKENRAQQFLEICQTEGADHFEGIAKAHAQVLVAYLDVHHPNWDHPDRAKTYFFAAVSEKFPQLVKKNSRGQFKFPEGPRVSDEVTGGTVRKSRPKRSPIAAVFRGIFLGLLILSALYGAKSFYERHGTDGLFALGKSSAPAPTPAAEIAPAPAPESAPAPAETAPRNATANRDFDAAPLPTEKPRRKRKAAEATPAEKSDTMTAQAAPASNPAPAPTLAPEPTLAPALSLAPPAATPPPATPPPRTTVTITRATMVNIPFGSTTLNAGTTLPFVGVEGTKAMVRFGPNVVSVPTENTDLGPR